MQQVRSTPWHPVLCHRFIVLHGSEEKFEKQIPKIAARGEIAGRWGIFTERHT